MLFSRLDLESRESNDFVPITLSLTDKPDHTPVMLAFYVLRIATTIAVRKIDLL